MTGADTHAQSKHAVGVQDYSLWACPQVISNHKNMHAVGVRENSEKRLSSSVLHFVFS